MSSDNAVEKQITIYLTIKSSECLNYDNNASKMTISNKPLGPIGIISTDMGQQDTNTLEYEMDSPLNGAYAICAPSVTILAFKNSCKSFSASDCLTYKNHGGISHKG